MTELTSEIAVQDFLGVSFSISTRDAWLQVLTNPRLDRFGYLVTPNVDHIVMSAKFPERTQLLQSADWRVCDSRILAMLARFRGLQLMPFPGSDMVQALLQDPRSPALRIAIIGPAQDDFEILCQKFPDHNFVFVQAPVMRRGDADWQETLQRAEAAEADILLLCLSFPKQEEFALDLRSRGHVHGIGMCVGASVDFLTGRQKRAPRWVNRIGMEWAWRLLQNPRRLWKRYLVEGPKIFVLFLKDLRASRSG
ncbi:WecB/TagA/CpsF family glycosyltransferase [Aestuariibius sp. HNIBRBA575]|uniref:WecB/TagA/CpsF family glycosyltransferase n=1 Tax=Aestuariibius sp. HNIBRBA575 TaxID=3233343 RepID=UPI0034A53367